MRLRTPHLLLAVLVLFSCAGEDDPAGDAGTSTDAPDGDVATPPDGDAADMAVPPAPVDGPGPFEVGYRTIETEYTPETFDEPRELNVALWYPTTETDGTAAIYRALIRRDTVYADPAPAGSARFPVVVFSHGNTGFAQQSYFLTERLASHGWLVIAPDHTDNTANDFSPSRVDLVSLLRPLDVQAALDAIEGLDSSDPLAGRVGDFAALVGHSFGGYTTLVVAGATLTPDGWDALCETMEGDICPYWTEPRRALVERGFADDRFKTFVPMAPWNRPPMTADSTASIEAPTFMLTSALDSTTPDAEDGDPLWSSLRGTQHLRASLTMGGHFTFANSCEFGVGFGDGCGEGFIDPAEAHELINALVVAWLRLQRTGDAAAQAYLDEARDGIALSRK